jgi:hypothetical protein
MLNRVTVLNTGSTLHMNFDGRGIWRASRLTVVGSLVLLLICATRSSVAQEKSEAAKERPKILMMHPLFVSPGLDSLVIVRGLRMDEITSVQLAGLVPSPEVTIVKKEKSGPPDRVEASVVGDTLTEVRFTLSADFSGSTVPVTVTSEAGTSAAFELLVLGQDQIIAEVEPNDSLRKAQSITAGKLISGQIGQARDVDVYEFNAETGQTVVAEVMAARHGSPLDAQLTLFDSSGQIVTIADDAEKNPDPRLETTLSGSGPWRLVLLDATDRGNSLNSYLLKLTVR